MIPKAISSAFPMKSSTLIPFWRGGFWMVAEWRVPPSFSVLPVELDGDVVLELALPRRKLMQLVGMLDGGPSGPRR